MAKINSESKGARGEREFAKLCRENGYDCQIDYSDKLKLYLFIKDMENEMEVGE